MEMWAAGAIGFMVGALFSAVVCAAIWIRHIIRTNHEQTQLMKQTLDLSTRQVAISEVLNRDRILALAPEIDKTQELVRTRTMGK